MKYRDITSMKLTRNILEFKTKVTPFMDDLKLEYIKKEQLEFKSEADAAIYFSHICEEYQSKELPKESWPNFSSEKIIEKVARELDILSKEVGYTGEQCRVILKEIKPFIKPLTNEPTISLEVFYNKELSDAIRELVKHSVLTYDRALKLLKFSKDYTRDVHVMKEMANVGISMDLLITTIKAINK